LDKKQLSEVDLLVCIGPSRELIAKGAEKAGLSLEKIMQIPDSNLAADKMIDIIKENDLVLVKGSRGMRMELIVKALMKEPELAEQLLVK